MTLDENIKLYIAKHKVVETLSKSNRLDAKEQAANVSVDMSRLHTTITHQIQNIVFGKENTHTLCSDRTEIAKMIGILRIIKKYNLETITCNAGEKSISIQSDIAPSLVAGIRVNQDTKQLEFYMNLHELVWYDVACGEEEELYGCCNFDEPNEDDASPELKAMSKLLNIPLKGYIGGSMHENWGYIGLDLDYESKTTK